MIIADLHLHTTRSDGMKTAEEVIAVAKRKGLRYIAITDHDRAYSQQDQSIQIISGIEMSTRGYKYNVHVLGYGFLPNHPAIEMWEQRAKVHRQQRAKALIQFLRLKGFPLEEEPWTTYALQRFTLAKQLVAQKWCRSTQEVFHRYLGDRHIAKISPKYPHPLDAITTIHAAGGKAFLAHPSLTLRGRYRGPLLTLPWDGVEVFYPQKWQSYWYRYAQQRGWSMSGGSDDHSDGSTVLGSFGLEEKDIGWLLNQ